LSTATLERLRQAYPPGHFAPQRFRPNIVVAPQHGAPGFVEYSWLGERLRGGTGAQLRLIDPCPRCVITTLPQGNLPHDPGILRAIGRQEPVASVTLAPDVHMYAVVGVYARVLREGTLCRGDSIWLA
jgi:uncharacterized protein YcbX